MSEQSSSSSSQLRDDASCFYRVHLSCARLMQNLLRSSWASSAAQTLVRFTRHTFEWRYAFILTRTLVPPTYDRCRAPAVEPAYRAC